MHYQSEDEAQAKWVRRSSRITKSSNRRFFKFCDRDGCTEEHVQLFEKLPFQNKVFFSTRTWEQTRCGVVIPSRELCVPDGLQLAQLSPRVFDSVGWIVGRSGFHTPLFSWLNCV